MPNISLSGAFIDDSPLLPIAQIVQLRFWLDSIERVVINATIRRVEKGRGIGVEFLSMTHTQYMRLREFVAVMAA
jgi:hypothetical protein